MPVGPYPNINVCEDKLAAKYKSATKARKVCSMLEKQSQGRSKNLRANTFESEKDLETFLDSKSAMEFNKNGDLYLKTFLFNKEISANLWGINYDKVRDGSYNLSTVKGKPIVEYINTGLEPVEYDDFGKIERTIGEMDHPPMDDHNLAHTLSLQEPYRVGTQEEVVEHPNDGSFWGLGVVQDPGVKRAFQEDPDMPFFTSSAIRSVGTHYVGTPVDNWIFLHTALVDRPAFGVRAAAVKAQCTGDSATCLTHLRRASVNLAAAKGIDMEKGCPFCTYAATKSMGENIRNAGLDHIASNSIKERSSGFVSSYLNKIASFNTDKKVSENTTQTVNSGQPTTALPNNVVEQAAAQQAQKEESSTLTLESRLMQEMKEKDELKAKLAKKDTEIASLQNDLKVATTFSSDLQKKVNDLDAKWNNKESEDRRKEIARIVKMSKLYSNLSEEEKEKKVDLYASLVKDANQVKEMLGAPEEFVVGLQQNAPVAQQPQHDGNNYQSNNTQGPQNGQPSMGYNAVSSTSIHYNDGTELGHNRTASVRDDISGQPDGLAVLNSLRNSYFNRGTRSEV